jgi:hypothetical protein
MCAAFVADASALDFHYVGAEIGQQLSAPGAGENARELKLRIPTKPPGYNGIIPPGIPE